MDCRLTLTLDEPGILRCRHTGEVSQHDLQTLTRFMADYRGKLLIDLSDPSGTECTQVLTAIRPYLPVTAIFGVGTDIEAINASPDPASRPVRYFDTEAEALTWLRTQ